MLTVPDIEGFPTTVTAPEIEGEPLKVVGTVERKLAIVIMGL